MDNRSEAPSALKRDEAKNEASRDPYVGLDSITETFKGWRGGEGGKRTLYPDIVEGGRTRMT